MASLKLYRSDIFNGGRGTREVLLNLREKSRPVPVEGSVPEGKVSDGLPAGTDSASGRDSGRRTRRSETPSVQTAETRPIEAPAPSTSEVSDGFYAPPAAFRRR